jgi:hypothetical protein
MTQTSGALRREIVKLYPAVEAVFAVIARSGATKQSSFSCLRHQSWIASLRSQ